VEQISENPKMGAESNQTSPQNTSFFYPKSQKFSTDPPVSGSFESRRQHPCEGIAL
jgi:hypothetical protein